MPEPWEAVRIRTAELRPEHWGTPEEVAAMAVPIRWASNRREAAVYLKEIAGKGTLTSKSGLSARLRRSGIGKLVSSVAVHYENNEGLKARHYLFAPLEYQGRIVIAKITVKEFHREENKLYSIEALDIAQ